MKKTISSIFLIATFFLPGFALIGGSSLGLSQAAPPEPTIEEPSILSEPVGQHRKVHIFSWNPRQKVKKFLGTIIEGTTDQWDIMRLLAGPNIIGVTYPEEKEMWGYLWMWSYKLQNPLEQTLILMDKPGKRIMKGKNPVELYLVFNENDVVERMDMILVKKKNSQY